ncbi:unnamed protein product, partial [Closterium sp. NIES-54]
AAITSNAPLAAFTLTVGVSSSTPPSPPSSKLMAFNKHPPFPTPLSKMALLRVASVKSPKLLVASLLTPPPLLPFGAMPSSMPPSSTISAPTLSIPPPPPQNSGLRPSLTLPAFAFGAASPSSSSHRPIAPAPLASSPPVPWSAPTLGKIATPQSTCSSIPPPTASSAALTSSSMSSFLTTPLLLLTLSLLPLGPSPGPTLSSHLSSLSLLSSPPLPLHSLRPPLLMSMTPPHLPPRPTQLRPLPPLPPPLTLWASSSSRVISRDSSSSSSSRFRSRGSSKGSSSSSRGSSSSSSSSGSRVSSRGSSNSRRVSSHGNSSRISSRGSSSSTKHHSSSSSTGQLPAPPLSSSLVCTLAPWTNSLEPLLLPPLSSLRTPMRSSSTFGTTLLSLPPSSLTSLAFPSLAPPPSPPSLLPPPLKRPSPTLMQTSGSRQSS